MPSAPPSYRAVSPQDTLERVAPYLEAMGITRTADITGLDSIGIPVYTTVRPNAWMLQVSSGKGFTHLASKCSSVMEAVEFFHSETPREDFLFPASENYLLETSRIRLVSPRQLGQDISPLYHSDALIDWLVAEDLSSGDPLWLPSDACYFTKRGFIPANTNGLASGNTVEEASLHALYELIERDAYAAIVQSGRVRFRNLATRVDPGSVPFPFIASMLERVFAQDCSCFLFLLPSKADVYTFWCGVGQLDHHVTPDAFNFGLGCHADPSVALSRAITEAVQSRLVFIHGSREDIYPKISSKFSRNQINPKVFIDYLSSIPSKHWSSVAVSPQPPLFDSGLVFSSLLTQLEAADLLPLYRVDMTLPEFDIPVVKIIAPRLSLNTKIV